MRGYLTPRGYAIGVYRVEPAGFYWQVFEGTTEWLATFKYEQDAIAFVYKLIDG